LQCQTPLHSLCRRLVEAACPVHDTHAAGVVTQANNHIVVALKIPHAPYKRCTKKFSGKVLTIYPLKITVYSINCLHYGKLYLRFCIY
ncbi:MAG: hypothetical protein NTZ51_10205, partial [Proteobacteria bacterium]|nr:hypothetical protein [Pseudomonadota bacterium]